MHIAVKATSFCQQGQRTGQEDALLNGEYFFAVCDGVGGRNHGEIASQLTCQTISSYFAQREDFRGVKEVGRLLNTVYEALQKQGTGENREMATTLTFLYLGEDCFWAAHMGDSRIYQFRKGNEDWIYKSKDHSLVQELIDNGQLTPEEALTYPKRNVITRCLTVCKTKARFPATVYQSTDIQKGDIFLLCSDGVYSCLSEDELKNLLEQECSLEEKKEQLAQICQNSSDNNTAILIEIGETKMASPKSQLTEVKTASSLFSKWF